jgi:hypothetical protein
MKTEFFADQKQPCSHTLSTLGVNALLFCITIPDTDTLVLIYG